MIRKHFLTASASIEALYMLCSYSFIILIIHIESQMKALGLYFGGNIRKDIWVSLQGLCSGGLIFGILGYLEMLSIYTKEINVTS